MSIISNQMKKCCQYIYIYIYIYIYKQELALNSLRKVICHKNQPTNFFRWYEIDIDRGDLWDIIFSLKMLELHFHFTMFPIPVDGNCQILIFELL